ncbi:protein phosphatase 1 regulatory subunit 14B-like [Meriones unguiculatus]|uniref:protein phosphatase 1 regulatory subunit 14B-like n=1 Tax=Meriones unguiculatus TaxID=10047 RepID=UPI00293EF20D|nr:protein phosphatase 1 regulatory subunit 14B-like [Meriones unguiculatus]
MLQLPRRGDSGQAPAWQAAGRRQRREGPGEMAREGHRQVGPQGAMEAPPQPGDPELHMDVDELLDMESDDTRAARVKELLVDCYKPAEPFIPGLLDKAPGMQKLSTPQKK